MTKISLKSLMIAASAAALSMTYVVPTYASDVDDPWLVRLRAVNVVPDESATITPIGGDAEISNQFIPELDISYFWSENIVDLGDVWLLPPTLTLQYHFSPRADFRPYVGAGVNYTIFYGEDEGPVAAGIDYSNSFGFALQGGFDVPLNDTYFFNVDVKKVFLQSDVTVDAGDLGTVTADVDINPWLIGVGVGRRF